MTQPSPPPPEPETAVCAVCGGPLADNFLPHSLRCDSCERYRPAPPPFHPPPELDPCVTTIQFVRRTNSERRLRHAA
jgi:hypothetical protein